MLRCFFFFAVINGFQTVVCVALKTEPLSMSDRVFHQVIGKLLCSLFRALLIDPFKKTEDLLRIQQ